MPISQTQLIEIETKLAYQEDTIAQLNDALYSQQKQISELERTCNLLLDRIKAISEPGPGGKPADEIPPHY